MPHDAITSTRARRWRRAEPLEQVVADAQRVGHRRQRRVHGARGREEAGVDDVEVVEVVGLAVDVERGRAGSVPKRTVPQWCAMPAIGICWLSTDQRGMQVAWQPSGPEQVLELAPAAACAARCCGRSWRGGFPCAVDRDAVARVGEVLGGQPEVDRVAGDVVEREPRREPRRAGAQDARGRTCRASGCARAGALSRRRPSSSR